MVQVVFTKAHQHFVGFKVSGHAYSDEPGKDLVCAAVSTLAQTLVNAVVKIGALDEESVHCVVKSGLLEIKLKPKEISDAIDIVFETILIGIEGIQDTYPRYVKHRIKEVHGDV